MNDIRKKAQEMTEEIEALSEDLDGMDIIYVIQTFCDFADIDPIFTMAKICNSESLLANEQFVRDLIVGTQSDRGENSFHYIRRILILDEKLGDL